MNWESVSEWSVLIAALAASVSALMSWRASLNSLSVARVTLHLQIDESFSRHEEVHQKLRPGGEWAGNNGPFSASEWVAVETYMGVFERIDLMISENLLRVEDVRSLYGYRYDNIVRNPVIRKGKLEKERNSWKRFNDLGNSLRSH